MTDHRLHQWSTAGWVDWAETARIARSWALSDWLWADLGGLQHAGELPAQAPITGCLWGWTTGRTWVRLRLDVPIGGVARVCGAVLTAGDGTGEKVDVVPGDPVPTFRSSHLRGNAGALDGRSVRCHRIVDRPLTFVELT